MASVRAQREAKSEQAATDAAAAGSVPALRDAVLLLIEAVQRIETVLAKKG